MIGAALLAGGVFGAKHALEPDHVAAVATLVEDDDAPATTGLAWGVGHSAPILLLGAGFLALDLRIPDAVGAGVEAVVAVVLVALGLRVIAGREAIGTAVVRHVHRRRNDASDDHRETPREHRHLRLGAREIGLAHSHADEESFAVGIVHGLAGSGGVVVALAAAAPTAADGGAFLLGFAVATVTAMGVAAAGWGRAVGRTDRLRILAGVGSVALGALLLAEALGLAVPL